MTKTPSRRSSAVSSERIRRFLCLPLPLSHSVSLSLSLSPLSVNTPLWHQLYILKIFFSRFSVYHISLSLSIPRDTTKETKGTTEKARKGGFIEVHFHHFSLSFRFFFLSSSSSFLHLHLLFSSLLKQRSIHHGMWSFQSNSSEEQLFLHERVSQLPSQWHLHL